MQQSASREGECWQVELALAILHHLSQVNKPPNRIEAKVRCVRQVENDVAIVFEGRRMCLSSSPNEGPLRSP